MRDGWTETTIGEIANIQQGKTLAINTLVGGRFPVYGANGVVGYHDEANYFFDVVALGCRGSCGTIHIVTTPSWLANNVMALWPRSGESVALRFLALLLEVADLSGEGVISGQVQPQITRASLTPLRVVIPPLEEQRRIVDVVASVDTYIDALKDKVAKARTARNAVLHELLSAGGPDWTETNLGDVVVLKPGKYIAKDSYVADGKYWIYGSNSVMGRYSDALVHEPHVVMAAIGAYAGAVRHSEDPSWVNNNAFALVPNLQLMSKWLFYWLDSFLEISSVVVGTGQPYVQRPVLMNQVFHLPPIEEQRRIVDVVESMDDMIAASEKAVAEAVRLRSGLLSDLLSGEHEIPVSYDSLLGAA